MRLHWQVYRFAIVGIASNIFLYGLYLLLTWLGVGPKSAMTLLYISSMVLTFFLNQRWTFRSAHNEVNAFIRYVSVYVAAYMINFLALLVFVDLWGFPHQIVQGIMVVCVACFTFLSLRCWVFQKR